jgi:hypothetical protein
MDIFFKAGQYWLRACFAEPMGAATPACAPPRSYLWLLGRPAVLGIFGFPSRATRYLVVVSRGMREKAEAGASQVFQRTASVIAPKELRNEKSSGRSWRKQTMSTASLLPIFSIWCRDPLGMWNI